MSIHEGAKRLTGPAKNSPRLFLSMWMHIQCSPPRSEGSVLQTIITGLFFILVGRVSLENTPMN